MFAFDPPQLVLSDSTAAFGKIKALAEGAAIVRQELEQR